MNKYYRAPSVVVYNREEIMDLIGPVKTQYELPPCDCTDPQLPPVWKEFNVAPLNISVGTGGCPEFDRVEIRFSTGGQTYINYPFSRDDGVDAGGRWNVMINNFMLEGAPGQVFDVSITLFDDTRSVGQACQTTIQIQGIND